MMDNPAPNQSRTPGPADATFQSIDDVMRKAAAYNPTVSKLPQLDEVQSGFAEIATLEQALPAIVAPEPGSKLAQVKQTLTETRSTFGQRVEQALYQALFADMTQLSEANNQAMVFANVPMVQQNLLNAKQRIPELFSPVADFLDKQGRPAMKNQVTAVLADIDKALQINAGTIQQGEAADARNAGILFQAGQAAAQTLVDINKTRNDSFARSVDSFDSYLKS